MMTMWMKSAFALGVVGAIVVGVASCGGGGFSCDKKGRCPNDTAPTQADIDACNKLVNDPQCGAKFQAVGDCAADQPASCGPDGKTQATTSAACKMQSDDYTACLTAELLDGGGGG